MSESKKAASTMERMGGLFSMRGQRPGVRRREYRPLHQVMTPAPAAHRDNPYLEWDVEDVVPCREHRVSF